MNEARPNWRTAGNEDALPPPTHRYESLALLGSGGMGNVELARQLDGSEQGRLAALKRISPRLEQEQGVVQSFLDEVWLVSALHHPNVVEAFDWGYDERGGFLAMEYIPGDSLRALVRAREKSQLPLPIDAAVELIACAAEGLHAAHELRNERGLLVNLVHRDVSPANVLVGFQGSVKLIDFGVAKAIGRSATTAVGMIKGKLGYMSPEQLRGEPLDRRADLFALGVVAWEALTLCRLYSAVDEYEVLRMVCDEAPVGPSDLRGDVPSGLDQVILRCLAKKPAERFASGAELARALDPWRPPAWKRKEVIAQLASETLPERKRWLEQMLVAPAPPADAIPPAPRDEAATLPPSSLDVSDGGTRTPTPPEGTPLPEQTEPVAAMSMLEAEAKVEASPAPANVPPVTEQAKSEVTAVLPPRAASGSKPRAMPPRPPPPPDEFPGGEPMTRADWISYLSKVALLLVLAMLSARVGAYLAAR